MKAILYPKYGSPDVLQLKEVEKPQPKNDQLLIKIHAASVNPFDRHRIRLGWGRPKDQRLGADIAGRVEAVGANVTQFQPGDEVFGEVDGGFAEYACADVKKVALKPANLPFEAAAAVPLAALTALQGLRDNGQIKAGQHVLIHGSAGGVGTFAVQLAKQFGAEVTAVCGTQNRDLVRSLGADHIIDYTKEDFTQTGQRFDLILAVNGYRPILAYRRVLRPSGRFVWIGASHAHLPRALFEAMLVLPLISLIGRQKMSLLMAQTNQKDLVLLKELLEAGKVVPVIDRHYPLHETASAIRYLEEGHPRGKIIITMEQF